MKMNPDGLLAASSRVALAAYLHDLGKFAERADMAVSPSDLDAHITQYCPFRSTDPGGKKGYHTHKHAAYTGLAFDLIERHAPDLIQGDMAPFASRSGGVDITDSLVNAAAAHHRPETFLQWVIATADRVASGFERDEFEQYNLAQDKDPDTGRNHYQARQLTLFERINRAGRDTAAAHLHRYPLLPLSPQALFPAARESCEPGDDVTARAEYARLWADFLASLDAIAASHRHNWSLWLDHFDTAWLAFTHAVPSATAFGTKPDVSLYDHSKSVAALATALWRWHEANGQCGSDAARALKARADWDEGKFLLVQGDFFGIQEFIFAEGSLTNKAAAKLLRGRSFQVSLFCELAALKVLDALALPPTSQIVNAAGKFLIVAPNTADSRAQLEQVRREINLWFVHHSFAVAGLGLVSRVASCNDFLKGRSREATGESRFKSLMQALFADLEVAKLQRFDLVSDTPAILNVDYPAGVCQYNARLPADRAEAAMAGSAALSRDQIMLGASLTREDRILIVRDAAVLASGKLQCAEVSIFGYFVAFAGAQGVSGKFGDLARDGSLVRCWDFSLPANLSDPLWNGYARRFINAYVPRFDSVDQWAIDKYSGQVDDADADLAMFSPKTLNHIACEDMQPRRNSEGWQGQVALMTLKGDVDNLGDIFQQGLREPTFAKMAALSRQMNAFFAVWLPATCQAHFPNTYTVFAGGDDFFLIGPWRSTQELAAHMADEFSRYVAGNPGISFSAGMVMTKPGLPMHTLASQAEEALRQAKGSHLPDSSEHKNAVVVFGERVRWKDWGTVQAAEKSIKRLSDDYDLSSGYVYGLLYLIDLATDTAKPEHAMWRSRFAYRTQRYVVDRLKPTSRSQAQTALAQELGDKGIAQLGTRFRIPLFNHLYSQR